MAKRFCIFISSHTGGQVIRDILSKKGTRITELETTPKVLSYNEDSFPDKGLFTGYVWPTTYTDQPEIYTVFVSPSIGMNLLNKFKGNFSDWTFIKIWQDPRDRIYSKFGNLDSINEDNEEFTQFIENIKLFSSGIKSMIENDSRFYFVKNFSDISKDPVEFLDKIFRKSGIKLDQKKIRKRTEKLDISSRMSFELWKNWSLDKKKMVNKHVGQVLLDLGYEDNLEDWLIEPEEKLVNEDFLPDKLENLEKDNSKKGRKSKQKSKKSSTKVKSTTRTKKTYKKKD